MLMIIVLQHSTLTSTSTSTKFVDYLLIFCDIILDRYTISSSRNAIFPIAFKKTNTHILNTGYLVKKYTLYSIRPERIDNVRSFTYLGQVKTNDLNKWKIYEIVFNHWV